MPASMTAFGREVINGDWGTATLEIRTVNHRYLDMSIRMPETVRSLEQMFREGIQARINRGKVDCTLRIELNEYDERLEINTALTKRLLDAARALDPDNIQGVNPFDVLRWPGVVNRRETDAETLATPLRELLNSTLDHLVDARRREGEKLGQTLLTRCEAMQTEVNRTREVLPVIIEGLRTRYRDKVHELLENPDTDRLEQEVLYLAQKMDVAEELDRLEIHLGEVRRIVGLEEPVGRRLDFLMQEMNREANTLASKSINIDTSNTSIELKVLIEQMREQIQNIE